MSCYKDLERASLLSSSSSAYNYTSDSPPAPSPSPALSITTLRSTLWSATSPSLDATSAQYQVKARLLAQAIDSIGMGRYQWQLFIVSGLGWMADNIWLQGIALTLPSLSPSFSIPEKRIRYTTTFLFLGLCLGSFTWGLTSDIRGRRLPFLLTLPLTALAGLLAAQAHSWIELCGALVIVGSGVGGSLPVDGAVFLEVLPRGREWLLTALSVWWPMGQLGAAAVGWVYFAGGAVEMGSVGEGNGEVWRGYILVLSVVTGVLAAVRLVGFHVLESPKFLLSRRRDEEAVAVVREMARRNGTETWLTVDILSAVSALPQSYPCDNHPVSSITAAKPPSLFSTITTSISSFSTTRLRPLFRTPRLALATTLIWFAWATIGMGYPLFNAFLPQYLSHPPSASSSPPPAPPPPPAIPVPPSSSPHTYRNYFITSLFSLPASLLASYLVTLRSPLLGRRGTLALFTLLSALFLLLFPLQTSESSRLRLSCLVAFSQSVMYGVLYAYTPELFPAPVRGMGTGVASFLNRATGLLAPIVAANLPGDGERAPVVVAGALILAAFVGIVGIPIETQGIEIL